MAACKWISVIKAEESAVKCVSYCSNKRKTHNDDFGKAEESQSRLLAYVANDEKTINKSFSKAVFVHDSNDDVNSSEEKEFFVDGIMCTRENAYSRMMEAQQMSKKTRINLAYHAVQSFKEGPEEMTPQQAHEIGMKLATELWGDEFVVLVATHLDKKHYHNHFVIGSTSPITGKRFNKCDREWRRMTECSDKLCREYGLHVIENKRKGKYKTQAEIAFEKKGIPTHKGLLQLDIDTAIENSNGWDEFIKNVKQFKYGIKFSNKYMSVTARGWERPIRIYYSAECNRGLGSEYTKERIVQRIEESVRKRTAEKKKSDNEPVYLYRANKGDEEQGNNPDNTPQKLVGTLPNNPKDLAIDITAPPPTMPRYKFNGKVDRVVPTGVAGLRVTYYRLSYKMCILPKPYKRKTKRRMSLYMRSELNKFHRYIDQVNFLANTKIDSISQLNTYKEYAESQMKSLTDERQLLRNKLRRCTNDTVIRETKSQISELTSQISVLRKNIKICADIADNTENVRHKINEDSRIEAEQLRANEHNKTKDKTERKYKT